MAATQSALYCTRNPVQSLTDALNRLGISTLRDIVWQIAANMRLFRVKGYTAAMRRLQGHSMFTAHMARLIAGHAGIASDQDRMHPEASGMMTRLWGLGSDVSEVVTHHHGGTRSHFSAAFSRQPATAIA